MVTLLFIIVSTISKYKIIKTQFLNNIVNNYGGNVCFFFLFFTLFSSKIRSFIHARDMSYLTPTTKTLFFPVHLKQGHNEFKRRVCNCTSKNEVSAIKGLKMHNVHCAF